MSAGPATGSAGTADDEYTTNSLNQYTARENNTIRVTGTTATAATVAVPGITTGKKDNAWGADLVPANIGGPAQGTATAYAALVGGGSGGADLIRSDSKPWFVPKASQVITYDDDGNLLADGVWSFTWNAENQLVRATSLLSSGSGFTRQRLDFKYDYAGRRIEKRVTNLDTSTETLARRFIYDGWNLVAELDGNGTAIQRSYTWGLDGGGGLSDSSSPGSLVRITNYSSGTPGTSYYPTYDDQGNVASLVNATSGALAAVYEYDPYGNYLRNEVIDSAVADNPFRYSTKYRDTETGLIYYGYRYYDPLNGRFINQDPIGESGGVNLYGFCGNSGVNGSDAFGMYWVYDHTETISYDVTMVFWSDVQTFQAVYDSVGGTNNADRERFSNLTHSGSITWGNVMMLVPTYYTFTVHQDIDHYRWVPDDQPPPEIPVNIPGPIDPPAPGPDPTPIPTPIPQPQPSPSTAPVGPTIKGGLPPQTQGSAVEMPGASVAHSIVGFLGDALLNADVFKEGAAAWEESNRYLTSDKYLVRAVVIAGVTIAAADVALNVMTGGTAAEAKVAIKGGIAAAKTIGKDAAKAVMKHADDAIDAIKGLFKRGIPGVCFLAGTLIATADGDIPIESLRVGDRVLTSEGDSGQTAVDPATWRKVTLLMPNPEYPADILSIELIRSETWLTETDSKPGAEIMFTLPEMGLTGMAAVRRIEPCPVIRSGAGRVVLATVSHFNSFVREVHLVGSTEPLQLTDRHRLFSVKRNDWVRADELQAGEELRTRTGTKQVESVQAMSGTHKVYNLEVETAHSYFAGRDQVLSHNDNPCAAGAEELAKKLLNEARKVSPNEIKSLGGDLHAAKRVIKNDKWLREQLRGENYDILVDKAGNIVLETMQSKRRISTGLPPSAFKP